MSASPTLPSAAVPSAAGTSAIGTNLLELPAGGCLQGRVRVPGDKSISHRALLFGAIAEGETLIEGLLPAEDPLSTAACLRAMGVEVGPIVAGQSVRVQGWDSMACRNRKRCWIAAIPEPPCA